MEDVQMGMSVAVTKDALNFQATMASAVINGSLDKGQEMQQNMARIDGLAAEGIGDGLVYSAARGTTRKTRIIAQGQQLLRLDEEEIVPPRPEESALLREKVLERLPGCGALVLSDYGKGVLLDGADGHSLCCLLYTSDAADE